MMNELTKIRILTCVALYEMICVKFLGDGTKSGIALEMVKNHQGNFENFFVDIMNDFRITVQNCDDPDIKNLGKNIINSFDSNGISNKFMDDIKKEIQDNDIIIDTFNKDRMSRILFNDIL